MTQTDMNTSNVIENIVKLDFNEHSDLKEYYCPNCNTRLMVKIGNNVCAGEITQICNNCGSHLIWDEQYL